MFNKCDRCYYLPVCIEVSWEDHLLFRFCNILSKECRVCRVNIAQFGGHPVQYQDICCLCRSKMMLGGMCYG
jgi:hypothetical protein